MSAEPVAPPICQPYPGLRPFVADEAHLYFGREKHRTELLKRLTATRFVAVVGTSGSGKSSLVQAGLLPDLLSGYLPGTGCDWTIVISKPGNDPLGRLANALSNEGWSTESNQLRTNSAAIADLAAAHLGPGQHLFLLIDQFEELFRLKVSTDPVRDADEKAAFVRLLLTAGGQRPDGSSHERVHVLIAMRSEFLGRASVYRGLPEAIDQGQYLIPRMTREQLRRAIERPALVCGGEVDERLVQQLLNELGDDQDYLPVLQHALMRCWEFRDNSNRITGDGYKKSGGLSGALSEDATGALNDVQCTLADQGTMIVKRVFQALRETDVNGGQTRRPTTVHDLCEMAACTIADLQTALEPFRKRSFLLPPLPVPLEASTLVDVSHEALLRGWDKLTAWINEDDIERQRYIRIATRAADEAGSAHPDYFVPPLLPVLVKFWKDREPPRVWAVRHHPGFDAAKAFLEESECHQEAVEREEARQRLEKERQEATLQAEIDKRRRTKRTMRISLGVATLVILGVSSALMFVMRQARTLEEQGEHLQALVVAAKMPTISEAKLPARLQLAVSAASRLNDPERQGELLRTLWLTPKLLDAGHLSTLGDPKLISAIAMSPSGEWLYVVAGNRIKTANLTSGHVDLDVVMRGPDETQNRPPDSTPLLLAAEDGALIEFNDSIYHAVRSTGTIRRLPVDRVNAIAISGDGRVAAVLADDVVAICDLAGSCQRHALSMDAPDDVALSADGSVLAVTGRQLAVFNTRPWKQRKIRDIEEDATDQLSISVDTRHVHICESGSLREFDVYDDSLDSRIVGVFTSLAAGCGVSAAGAYTAHDDGAILTWTPDGALTSIVSGLVGDMRMVAMGGMKLVVADAGRLQLWDVTPYGHVSARGMNRFGKGGAYVYVSPSNGEEGLNDKALLLNLDSGELEAAPVLQFDENDAPLAVSDSMALAAVQVRSADGDEVVVFAPGENGAVRERLRHKLIGAAEGKGPSRRFGYRVRPPEATVTFSPDDRYVAIGTAEATTVYDAASGSPVRELPGKSVLLFLSDDHVLAFDTRGVAAVSLKVAAVSLREVAERRLIDTEAPAAQPQGTRRFLASGSADTKRIAVAQTLGQTSSVQVFTWPDLSPLPELRHGAAVVTLSFSGRGENLLISTDDGVTHVWDVDTGREIATIPPPGDDPSASVIATFTPGGNIAIANANAVMVLPNDLEKWRIEACNRLVRNLTEDEWTVFVGADIPYERTCPDRP